MKELESDCEYYQHLFEALNNKILYGRPTKSERRKAAYYKDKIKAIKLEMKGLTDVDA